jgi:branched-chain amino acid transport system substrate-binding protein
MALAKAQEVAVKFRIFVAAAALACALAGREAGADDALKIGLILPMTGPFASTGKQVDAAVKLYIARHGDTVAGRRIEILLRDDTGVAPDKTNLIAQELVAKDKAAILAGFGLTPLALAAAPVATQARVPMIVMASGALLIPQQSPYIVRTSFTLPQQTAPMADWSVRNGIKKVFTIVTDYQPGFDAETTFTSVFASAGGTIVGKARVPLTDTDFPRVMQRAKETRPDAVFVFVPSGEGAPVMKAFSAGAVAQSGVKLIGTGDVTDDDILDGMGDVALGAITSHFYSAAHPSPENKAFVAAFEQANGGMRPNYMAVGGYDGMHLVYEVLKKTNGASDGDSFVAAAKGMAWQSPRGPVVIDGETRDIIQDVYLRRVERVDGHLYNVEFDRISPVWPDATR